MFFKQFYLDCLAHASYMIADPGTRTAVVVDPRRDVDIYIDEAKNHGFQIEHVILTHFHADFISGHLELRDRVGAKIHLGADGKAEYEVEAAHDGDVLQFGQVRLQFLQTPGHTPEGISVVVYDTDESQDIPHSVLTGDTLFIGDVGRPDLMASIGVTAEELAGMLYDSLHHKLLSLPDETRVYPAHGAGSLCGKNISKETVSTMGEQRRYNYALQPMDRDKFIEMVATDQPEAPDYFGYDAMLNRKERPTLVDHMKSARNALSVDDVLDLSSRGAQLLDVRSATDFAGAHLQGSINIGLKGQFASWAGTLLSNETPIVLIAHPEDVEEASMRLGRIGFDNIAGFLKDGPASLQGRSNLLARLGRITSQRLSERLGRKNQVIVDVRTAGEYDSGHLEGAVNIPLNQLRERMDEIPKDRDLILHCAGGYRSSTAASLLLRSGFDRVTDLIGGYGAYKATVEST